MQVWIEPFAQRCCCDLNAFISTGHFGGRDDVREEMELPSAQLSAIAEVEILGQRVVLPTARIVDRLSAPHAGRTVEVEEVLRAVAPAVFEDEVPVEQDRLDSRQQRIVLVDVAPARLHHTDLGVGEVVDGALQEVGSWNEVGVEDRDELAACLAHAGFERAGLVPAPIGAMDILDVHAAERGATHRELGDTLGLVDRIVEYLYFEAIAGVVHLADRIDQPVHDVHLVIDGQLYRDGRQVVKMTGRRGHAVLVFHVDVHKVSTDASRRRRE